MIIEGVWALTGEAVRIETAGGSVGRVSTTGGATGGSRDAHKRDLRPLSFVSPGFVDLQVNGYRGIDYSSAELRDEDVEHMVRAMAAAGTTAHLPTIITSPAERIVRNLGVLARARRASPLVFAAIPGYHIEGPFLSPEDGFRGAHTAAYLRLPDTDEFDRWQEAAEGLIRIVTLAPELPGALRFIEHVRKAGAHAAIGHTAATPQVIRDAVDAGATLSTHLGNGSAATLPRHENAIWAQSADDRLQAGLIADGFHLPDYVLKSLTRAKGLDRAFLVSDVAVLAGCPTGVHRWGEVEVDVHADGHLGLHGTPYLAGAGHLLDRGIATLCRACGVSLAEAVRTCTVNPARVLGLDVVEFPAVGAEAGFTQFDYSAGADTIQNVRTYLGDVVFSR